MLFQANPIPETFSEEVSLPSSLKTQPSRGEKPGITGAELTSDPSLNLSSIKWGNYTFTISLTGLLREPNEKMSGALLRR